MPRIEIMLMLKIVQNDIAELKNVDKYKFFRKRLYFFVKYTLKKVDEL